jgi:Transposase DNA-binding
MELSKDDGSWVLEELSKTNFSDLRLNKRFQILSEQLAKKPSQTINHASTDWAAAKAAYRFFDNPKVTPEKILEAHYRNTELRIKNHARVVFVQDTTVLDFSKHFATSGLGHMAQSRNGMDLDGLFMHPTLALTDKGLPLGLIKNKFWARDREKKVKSHARTKVPLKGRESFKWTEGLEAAQKFTSDREVIMVCTSSFWHVSF